MIGLYKHWREFAWSQYHTTKEKFQESLKRNQSDVDWAYLFNETGEIIFFYKRGDVIDGLVDQTKRSTT